MRPITLLSLLLFILVSCSVKKNILDVSEKWNGLGYQTDINETWKIEVTKLSKSIYFVNYPDIPCSGEWTIVKVNESNIILTEVILKDISNCIPTSEVVITRIDDKNLSVTFFLPGNKTEPNAFGTLSRRSQ